MPDFGKFRPGMEGIRVFLVGSSLFADSVAQMLRESETVIQVDCFSLIAEALHNIDAEPPDVLIFADVDTTIFVGDTPFLPICPDIPVICTDHQSNLLKLITSTNINARLPDLINALTFINSNKAHR